MTWLGYQDFSDRSVRDSLTPSHTKARCFPGGVERGERGVSIPTLHQIAQGLGVSLGELLTEVESPSQPDVDGRSDSPVLSTSRDIPSRRATNRVDAWSVV